MEAAVQGLEDQFLKQDLGSDSSLALRQYGGACNGANSRVVVPFAPNNQEQVGAAISELENGGDATFAQGMAEGTKDFADAAQFEGSLNVLVGIVGSADTCAPGLAARVLNDQIHAIENRIAIRVIGLALTRDQKTLVDQAVEAIGGQTYFVTTAVELEDALASILAELETNRVRLALGDEDFLQTPIPGPEELPAVTLPTEAAPTDNAVAVAEQDGNSAVATQAPAPTAAPEPSPTATAMPTPTLAPAAPATATPPPAPTSTPAATAPPIEASTPVPAASTPTPAPTIPVVLPTATPIAPTPTPLPGPPDCYATFVPTPPLPSGQSLPHVIVGAANIDGIAVPDGTAVTAWVEGALAAATASSQGRYGFSVEPPKGLSYVGKTVLFKVGDCEASPTIAWQAGAADPVDLTAITQ